MPETLLVVEGLQKVYRARKVNPRGTTSAQRARRPALDDVSITLERGEVLGIVGESGSGKSTLARCLTLLERPSAGRVVFDGVDLTRVGGRELRRRRRLIQIIFQDPYASLNPRLSVGSTLGEVLRVHKLAASDQVDRRVHELLALVGLPSSAANRYPSDFSGGQRQRICIARALAAAPQLLIADEAVSALDVSIQAQVLNLLLHLRDELGLTMIFISHDLHVVRLVAPRVAVMFAGQVVEALPSGVALDDARHPYTQALLAATPRVDGQSPEEINVSHLTSELPATGCAFRARCPYAHEQCSLVDPPLLPVTGDHNVACHWVRASAGQDAPT